MTAGDEAEAKKGFTVNDRRWWLQDDLDANELAAGEPDVKPSYIEELEQRLAEKDRLLAETLQAHRESKADLEAVRQRLERDQERQLEVERARLAEPFLDVLDNLQRLLLACREQAQSDPLREGAELVVRQLADRLQELGLVPIAAVDQPFDPNTMEAMATAEVPEEQVGLVLDEIRPGYRLGERVVRPAGVRVGVAKRG